MDKYKSAFHAIVADMAAITTHLGFEGHPGLGQIIERIEMMRSNHFRGATKMIVDQVVAETNVRNHPDWGTYVKDIIDTADRIRKTNPTAGDKPGEGVG